MRNKELQEEIAELEKMLPVWKRMSEVVNDYYIRLNYHDGVGRLARLKLQLQNNADLVVTTPQPA